MVRSATDATRFTATSPHAYAKPSTSAFASASSSTPASTSSAAVAASIRRAANTAPSKQANAINKTPARLRPIPRPRPAAFTPGASTSTTPRSTLTDAGETPHEKVARLRAQRLAAIESHLSFSERLQLRSRGWADNAHRWVVFGLVGLTVLAAGVTSYAVADMILHNRRKRTAFYAEQHLLYVQRLADAVATEKAGVALTPDQKIVLEREREVVARAQARKEDSWAKRIKGVVLGGIKVEDVTAGSEQSAPIKGKVPTEGDVLELLGLDAKAVAERADRRARGEIEAVVEDGIRETRPVLAIAPTGSEKAVHSADEKAQRGGILDLLADQTARKLKDTGSSGWNSLAAWRRSKSD